MKEIQKPNDIFIATLSAPEASTIDLLRNNINADNTSLLTPELYKETPFIKKQYTKDGVFNEEAFKTDYLKAYLKYTDLADGEAETAFNEYLEWDKNDRYKPLGGKVWDTTPTFTKLKNPAALAHSFTGINSVSDSVWTPEELAQSNFIYDPEKGEFLNETPESMPFYKKMFGDTLVYAKWEEDGYHTDAETGELILHHKGEWKTDKDGNYYTEILGNRDLLDKQVVALGDILTDEGSLMNKVDFFDSDGYDKSGFGIFAKTVAPMIPYIAGMLIPGANYYATLSMVLGLTSVLPTYYKALESIFTGENPSVLSKKATTAENWFKKFDNSKSYKGREGFFTWESAGELVSDVFAQLYLQRAAASAAKWFKKAPKKPAEFAGVDIESLLKDPSKLSESSLKSLTSYTLDLNKYIKGTSVLGGKLNLGYMGLISAADVYNDALVSGYDRRTAGVTALASALALYKVMNFNETTRGIGNWMLDKTTGYSPELERGTLKKLAKDLMKEVETDIKSIDKGTPKSRDLFRNFLSKLDDLFVIKGEDVWKRSLIEGVEEVSEEVIQDSIKGIVDTCSYFGLTGQKGSFGGWSNVFSEEGFQRYLATFLGGAVGGGIFAAQNKLESKFFTDTPSGKQVDYTIDDAIIDGRYQELIDLIPKCKKFFNKRQTASLGEIDGEQIHMSADSEHLSQADVIAEQVKTRINTRAQMITRLTEGSKYNPNNIYVYRELAKQYKDSGFDELYVKKKWSNLVHEIADLQTSIDMLSQTTTEDGKTNTDDLKAKQEQLKAKQKELHDWQNGVLLTNNTLAALVYLNKNIASQFLTLDVDSFAQDVLNVDYKNAPEAPTEGKLSKIEIQKKWNEYKQKIDKDTIIESTDKVVSIIKKLMPSAAAPITDWVKNESAKNWFLTSPFWNEDGELEMGELTPEDYRGIYFANIIDYLNNNPKYWSLHEATLYDLAKALVDEGAIDLSDYTPEQLNVLQALINNEAQSTGVTVWNTDNLEALIDAVNLRIEKGDDSDIYVNQLRRLSSKSEETTESGKEEAVIDIDIPGIKTKDLSKVSVLTLKIRLKNILDVVEDLPFVDEELYRMLDLVFTYERNMALKAAVTKALESQLTSMDGDDPTLAAVFTSRFFNSPRTYTLNTLEGATTVTLQTTVDTTSWDSAEGVLTDLDNFKTFVTEISKQLESFKGALNISTTENLLIDSASVSEFQTILSNLATKIDEFTIVPEELQKKWDVVRSKTRRQNPLLKIVKDLCHKFGINNDSLIEYLWQKEDAVRNNTTQNYELSAADKQALNDIKGVIGFAQALVSCMSDADPKWGEGLSNFALNAPTGVKNNITSFNGVVRNAILTGNDKEHKLDDFPIFDRRALANVQTVFINLENKVDALLNLSFEQEKRSEAADIETRAKYNVNFCLKLSLLHLELPDNTTLKLSDEPYDLDSLPEDIELANEQMLCELGNQVNTWINKLADKTEATKQVLEKLSKEFPLAYEQELTITEGLLTEDKTVENPISQTLMWRSVVRAIAADPKQVNELFLKGYSATNLIPRFDQEVAVKEIIAKHLNPEIYQIATDIEYSLLGEAAQVDENLNSKRIVCNNLSLISGGAGAGKSTIMSIILKALTPEKVLFLAPTLDKVNDLLKIDYDKKTGKTFTEFFGSEIEEAFKAIDSALANKLVDPEFGKVAFASTDPYEFSVTVPIKGKDTEISFTIIHGTTPTSIQNILLSDRSRSTITDLMTADLIAAISGSTIFIDEATNLSMFLLVLLQELVNKDPSIEVQEFGDPGQLSKQLLIKINSATLSLRTGLPSVFMHVAPPLSGKLRLKNSARSMNLNNITNVVKPFTSILRPVNVTGREYTEVVDQFKTTPLKYKDLIGDQIVEDTAQATDKLKTLSEEVNKKSKSFVVIYQDPAQIAAIKTELKNAGFTDAAIEDSSIYRSLETIQGAEADYVYIYNLSTKLDTTSSNPYFDTDVDLQRIYTALSRSKEFTLIQSANSNDLFTSYGLRSIVDEYASEYSTGSYETLAKNRIETLTLLNEKLPTRVKIEGTSSSSSSGTSTTPTGTSSASTASGSSVTSTTTGTLEPEETTESGEVDISGDAEEDVSPETAPDPEVEPSGTLKAPTTVPQSDFLDAIEIYGYYTRLGIPVNVVQQLGTATKDDATNILNTLFGAATIEEQHKDLLGFWKYGSVSYTSGADLLQKFVTQRNQLLYYGSAQNTDLYIILKRKTDADWAYLKPNDETSRETKDGLLLSTVAAEVKNGDDKYYVTIARVGYNAKESGKLWSDTYAKMLQHYLLSTSSGSNIQEFYKLKYTTESAEHVNYKNKRGAKIEKIVRKEIIAITGLRDYKIIPTISTNAELIEDAHLKFGRMSVAELKKLGYKVELLTEPFDTADRLKEAYNEYRIEDISDNSFKKFNYMYGHMWARVTPIGVASETDPRSKIVLVLAYKKGNIWENLQVDGKLHLKPSAIKSILHYIAYAGGYKGKLLYNLRPDLVVKKGSGFSRVKETIELWDNVIKEFSAALQDSSQWENYNALSSLKDVNFATLFSSGHILQPDKPLYNLQKVDIPTSLLNFLNTDASKDFLFDMDLSLSDRADESKVNDLIVTRVFEAPKGYIDFNEFDNSDILTPINPFAVNATAVPEVVTSITSPTPASSTVSSSSIDSADKATLQSLLEGVDTRGWEPVLKFITEKKFLTKAYRSEFIQLIKDNNYNTLINNITKQSRKYGTLSVVNAFLLEFKKC